MRTSRSRYANIIVAALAGLAAATLVPAAVNGFDERDTHPRITELAARRSALDSLLKTDLGIADGIDATLKGLTDPPRPIFRWLRSGSTSEDVPTCRASNHFHNPLRPFTSSRVTDQPLIDAFCPDFQPIRSNVTWGTRHVSPAEHGPATGNPFDWDAARASFLNALTLTAPADREAALAQTFETLGHVMHLVQDLAVPAHVRNDFNAHLGFSLDRLAENGFEQYVRLHPDLVSQAAPAPLDLLAGPVTRFWDTDRYTGANPTSGTAQGLAEYTNANFVSLDTVLTEDLDPRDRYFFPYPRLTSTNAADLFGQRVTVVRSVRAEDGRVDTGLYVDKTGDGEVVSPFLRAGYLLGNVIDQAPPGTPIRLALQLDDEVHRSYAERLVPMALGYSRGLLDYFFRGRLDVDLVENGGGLRLEGINASADVLDGGTLAVYADGNDGGRRLASAAVGVGRVEPGSALPAVAVAPGAGAERFVAVYTGSLGEERQADTVAGGVIGKVLGGHRVEELFSDGTKWNLRTPKGIFPLPILRSDIVDLRWGDADNTLVGRTAFGTSGQPNLLRAYRINRPQGSVDVPLRAMTDGGQEVDVRQFSEATFPFGLEVGGLRLNSTIDYRQYLVSFVRTMVFNNSALVSDDYSDGKVELVVDDSASAALDWRLTLDREKLNTFRARPYLWQLQQIGLTTDGHLVALVRIRLTQPDASLTESFAVFPSKRFVWCAAGPCSSPPDVQDGPPARVRHDFGNGATTHWALVDVSEGRILYSTAAGGVVVNHTAETVQFREVQSGPFPDIVATAIVHRIEDGKSSYPLDPQGNLRFGGRCTPAPDSGIYEAGRVDLTFGVLAASASQYRAELARTEFPAFSERLSSAYAYCVGDSVAGRSLVAVSSDERRVYLNDALGAFRVPDGSERVALLFSLPQGLATGFGGASARVVAWDPLAGSASRRHDALSGDNWQLVTAAHDVAVVTGSNDPRLTAVPLQGDQAVTAFPMSLDDVFDFRAVSPAFLYSTRDLKFYRYQPSLLRTALPATLAAGGSATGDYHAVRLP